MPFGHSTAIGKREITRGTTEPTNVREGHLWIDTRGNNIEQNIYTGTTWGLLEAYGPDTPHYPVNGSFWRSTEGNNTEDYFYRGGSWELITAHGPDNPSNSVDGALWVDTGAGSVKRYDGAIWQDISVTDHGALSGLGDDDHPQYALRLDKDTATPTQYFFESGSPDQWNTVLSKTAGNEVYIYHLGGSSGVGFAFRVTWDDGTTTTFGAPDPSGSGNNFGMSGSDDAAVLVLNDLEGVRTVEEQHEVGQLGALIIADG